MADLRLTPERLPAWHSEPWVRLLEAAFEADGPTKVGKLIGYSPGLVTGIVKGYYDANPANVAEAVMATLGQAEVTCPVLDVISLDACRRHRKAEFSAANPLRVRLFRTCRQCPNNPDATDR